MPLTDDMTTFGKLNPGDVFDFLFEPYIKVYPIERDGQMRNARKSDGHYVWFNDDTDVVETRRRVDLSKVPKSKGGLKEEE